VPTALAAAAAVILAAAQGAGAAQWKIIGSRQLGMGGAGVACTEDSTAVYWNPAALGVAPSWGAHIDASLGYGFAPETLGQIEDIVSNVENIESSFDTLEVMLARLNSPPDGTTHADPLTDLQPMLEMMLVDFVSLSRTDLGMTLDAGAGAQLHFGNLGLNASGLIYVDAGLVADFVQLALANFGTLDDGVTPADAQDRLTAVLWGTSWDTRPTDATFTPLAQDVYDVLIAAGIANTTIAEQMAEEIVDQANAIGADLNSTATQAMLLNMVTATVGAQALVNVNDTGVSIEGLFVYELSAGLSFPIMGDNLFIGGAAKALRGKTCAASLSYDDVSAGGIDSASAAIGNLLDQLNAQFTDPANETEQIAFDLAVLWKPMKLLRAGLVVKNANGPAFDLPGSSGKFGLEPMTRVGIALYPLPGICLAADMDLTEDYSQIARDYGTQRYSLGAEVNLAKVIQVRAGICGNLLVPEAEPAYTAGLGFRIGSLFALDLAASLNGNPADVTSLASGGDFKVSSIPEAGAVSLSLQLNTKW